MELLPERPTLFRDLRLFGLLGVTGVALLVLLVGERAALEGTRSTIATFEEKLVQATNTVRTNREVLLPPEERILNPGLLAEKSLRTLITEAAQTLGIAGSLESITPGEDTKNRLVKARVSLRNLTLRKTVEFIVALKRLGAGIRDPEATLRMQGYKQDQWRLEITLEAPEGVPPQAITTNEARADASTTK